MTRLRLTILFATVLLVAGGVGVGVAADEAPQVNETYKCRVTSIGGGKVGTTRVDVRITRWSSEEERQALIGSIAPGRNPTGLYKELHNKEATGHIKPQNKLAYELRYAREFMQDGRRIIIAATDRPLFWNEIMNAKDSKEFNVGLVVLNLDPETNEGFGKLSVGTRIRLDEKTGQFVVETGGTQPMHLSDVKLAKKK